ncbi:MAG: hypothetical protein KF830_03560 [Planctomycetes bacterium]|nr:hypothetical protein [Planctomycetota bacterium]
MINTATFFDYADPCALSAILGAALAHEYVHCITLVNSRNLETGTWDDECGLWENEKLCHLIERGLIECMVSCGCAQCTGGGMQAILDRYNILHDYYLHYCDLLGVC